MGLGNMPLKELCIIKILLFNLQLENDFNNIYPEHDMLFYANWPEFSKKVLVDAKNSKDKNVQKYISMYNVVTDEGMLTYLFSHEDFYLPNDTTHKVN